MKIIYGDCLDVMKTINDDSIDLIMTSPPYADARKYTYGGVKPDDYAEWFLPRAAEIKRIMKPTGSFVLNIKERAQEGERLTYVLKLILALKETIEFRLVDEFIWHKTNSFPTTRPEGFRDAWERLIHLTKAKGIKINKHAVAIPPSKSTLEKSKRGYKQPTKPSNTGSPFSNHPKARPAYSYPPNVIYGPNITFSKGHSAAYPDYLPEFFIKAFTEPGDTVLDPFSGSHTTARVAESLDRIGIGIEIIPPKDN